uniref:PPPDE domain-containing protein n=1 Tax=Nelumbo nucifera TaxID=4432 RepID=A0A822XRL2_NELNU|nr:TPA_asm: hypothetical protein HUJ06_023202 [Nelumbo nucifera]
MKLGSKKGCNSNMPCHKRGKSACFSLFPKVKSASYNTGGTPVYLNVYDLTPMNGYVYWAGLGVFHSGVEVHGVEYAFGAHDYPSSGVFEVEPRQCPGFKFRKSIFMGTTCLDPTQVLFATAYSPRPLRYLPCDLTPITMNMMTMKRGS